MYGVLGVHPRAREAEIKAAFRKLAKRYHPDVSNGDTRAEQRFKEINEAHAILTNPDARARYDAALQEERFHSQHRTRNAVGIMATSFVLTVMVISTPIVWRRHQDDASGFAAGLQWMKPAGNAGVRKEGVTIADGKRLADQSIAILPTAKLDAEAAVSPKSSLEGLLEAPSPSLKEESAHDERASSVLVKESEGPGQKAMGVEQAAIPGGARVPEPADRKSAEGASRIGAILQEKDSATTVSAMAIPAWKDVTSWTHYRNASFGFALRYPGDVFAFEPALSDENVKRFRSRDGRAVLRIFGTLNVAGRTLAQYRTALIQERYPQTKFDYAPQRETWFVLSGFAGNDIFYERVTFSCDKRSFHGWMVVFPAAEREVYDWITEEMHRNYRHSNGPKARCGPITPKVSLRQIEGAGGVRMDAGLRQRKQSD
ncbi:MAG: J domain-containing protein [Rhodospirillales bacterium]|nr:J domain-containing protein [Rhodospirillales bacterium]